jgi:DNA modification methylase
VNDCKLILGDCLDVMRTLKAGSVDAVVTDPPYPCIKRSYGTWTEAEWFDLMWAVVPECMRVLKPTGSAVFILQPNSERVGRMRTWLWEFMAWVGKEWGIVQDAWWWNYALYPMGGAPAHGLMRGSLKACVWIGPESCYRDQESVLWEESQLTTARRLHARAGKWLHSKPGAGGHHVDDCRMYGAAERRQGVTPFNVLPFPNADRSTSAGAHGHCAGTPLALCSWWVRYLCPRGGTVLDPFSGSATVGLAALNRGARYVGIERLRIYHDIARRRLAAATRGVAA